MHGWICHILTFSPMTIYLLACFCSANPHPAFAPQDSQRQNNLVVKAISSLWDATVCPLLALQEQIVKYTGFFPQAVFKGLF